LKSLKSAENDIGLSADMDARQLIEKTDVPYISTKPCTMHACGYHGHTPMLLIQIHLINSVYDLVL
jgi:metal-dependent amidase/aminoacylase/carboxypeptidase family protein